MSLHVIILSGMNAADTTQYLHDNGFQDDIVLENQIQRYTKYIGNQNPVKITLWVALNTILTQLLLVGIKYRIKNIIYLYHPFKPITLIRVHGWYKYVMETFKSDKYRMILCCYNTNEKWQNPGYDRVISHTANMFLYNEQTIPHYSSTLNKILKKFN